MEEFKNKPIENFTKDSEKANNNLVIDLDSEVSENAIVNKDFASLLKKLDNRGKFENYNVIEIPKVPSLLEKLEDVRTEERELLEDSFKKQNKLLEDSFKKFYLMITKKR